MATVFERWAKRRQMPVVIEGETSYVRSLTNAEVADAVSISDIDLQTWYAIGLGAVDETGQQEFPNRTGDETKEAWAERIKGLCGDVPRATSLQIRDAVFLVTNTPGVEKLAKN